MSIGQFGFQVDAIGAEAEHTEAAMFAGSEVPNRRTYHSIDDDNIGWGVAGANGENVATTDDPASGQYRQRQQQQQRSPVFDSRLLLLNSQS